MPAMTMRYLIPFISLLTIWACQGPGSAPSDSEAKPSAVPPLERPRVIISTDIGGSDPDDYQSMVHFLVFADRFEVEGLVSSPPRQGRARHILEVLDAYEQDYPRLSARSDAFPPPAQLRRRTRQGAAAIQRQAVPDSLSEGAAWIIERAQAPLDAPLYVLVWGSITDVAQAVHHEPGIKSRLRVYSIGSWNTRQDPMARDYLYEQHPDLWWVENNTTFRGMYMGGLQRGEWGNEAFVKTHVKGHGALGDLFWEKKRDIKMGDTPSVFYLMHGDPDDPTTDSWGGAFVPTEHGPFYWTDNPADSLVEADRPGARTVNRFRKAYLEDWAQRMDWLQ